MVVTCNQQGSRDTVYRRRRTTEAMEVYTRNEYKSNTVGEDNRESISRCDIRFRKKRKATCILLKDIVKGMVRGGSMWKEQKGQEQAKHMRTREKNLLVC